MKHNRILLTIISLLSFAYANAQELNLGSFDPESKIKEAFILDDGYRRSCDGLVFLSSRDSLGKEIGRTEPLFTMAYRRSDGNYAIAMIDYSINPLRRIVVCVDSVLNIKFYYPIGVAFAFPFENGISRTLSEPGTGMDSPPVGAVNEKGEEIYKPTHLFIRTYKNMAMAVDTTAKRSELSICCDITVKDISSGRVLRQYVVFIPRNSAIIGWGGYNDFENFFNEVREIKSFRFGQRPTRVEDEFISAIHYEFIGEFEKAIELYSKIASMCDKDLAQTAKMNIDVIQSLSKP